MAEKQKFEDVIALAPNRRSFVQKLGIASAALGSMAASKGLAQAPPTGPSDIDIMNFALNLEYLEAEFYTVAVTGQTLSQQGFTVSGSGNAGATTGGAKVPFTDPILQSLAQELAFTEQQHVNILQAAIPAFGGVAVSKPAINLNALGLGFGNQSDFLVLSRIFEDIGVTAYGGAAPLISNKSVLGVAARILAVESGHAGAIRMQMAMKGIASKPLDGADHIPPPSGSVFINIDSQALTEVRTPGQVLYLAYNAPNASGGGFFPNGVNGTLNTSSAAPAVSDGSTLSANPNPIPVTGGGNGVTTISWNAPTASIIEIHVGSPTGPLFTRNISSGSMQTGPWVTNGTTFYLQDVSNGKALTTQNTLSVLVVNIQRS